jgi:hypothetical protein
MPADHVERRDVTLTAGGIMQTYHRWIWGLVPVQRSVSFARCMGSRKTFAVTRAGRINRTQSASSGVPTFAHTNRESIVTAVLLVNSRTNEHCCVKAAIEQLRHSIATQRLLSRPRASLQPES